MGSSPSRPCRLLALPFELQDKIVNEVESPLDRIALVATCQTLADRHYLPAVVSKLQLHSLCLMEIQEPGEQVTMIYLDPQLFCLSGAVQGEAGFAPFFMSTVELSPDCTKITVGLTFPAIDRFDDEWPTRCYCFLHMEGERASMDPEYGVPLLDLGEERYATETVDVEQWSHHDPEGERTIPLEADMELRTTEVDWRMTMAGRLIPATGELLKTRFKCPECKGEGTIEGMSMHARWPDIGPMPYECRIRCPRCVGYYEAYMDKASEIQRRRDEFDDEEEAEEDFADAIDSLCCMYPN